MIRRLLLVTSCYALAACARLDGQPFQQAVNDVVPIPGDGVVAQTFRAPGATVSGVDLLVATYGGAVDGRLDVTLRSASGAVAGEGSVPGEELADNAWVGVTLEQEVDVEGPLRLEVRRVGDAPVGLYADIPPPELAPGEVEDGEVLLNDPYPEGALVLDGRERPGDLAFRVTGDGSVLTLAGALATDAGVAARRTPVALAAWVAVLAGLVAGAVLGLRGTTRPRAEREREEAGAPT